MLEFKIYAEFPTFSYEEYDEIGNLMLAWCEEQDFNGDAHGYSVELDGTIIANFGDSYHDKGYDRAEAFCEGYAYATEQSYRMNHCQKINKKYD